MVKTLQEQIQEVYEKAYNESVIKYGHNEVAIGVQTNNEPKKIFIEKDFFGCGFNWIKFKCVGKNKELRALPNRKSYNGFNLIIKQLGWQGNGDWPQQTDAYRAVVNFLNGLGYDVGLESVID